MTYANLDKQRSHHSTVMQHVGEGTEVSTEAFIVGVDRMKIGSGCYIGPFVYMRGEITIGNDVWIGPFCDINGEAGVVIEDKVGIGNGVRILTCYHDPNATGPIVDRDLVRKPVKLCYGCDIGVGSLIAPGVTIGKEVQIKMGEIVLEDR